MRGRLRLLTVLASLGAGVIGCAARTGSIAESAEVPEAPVPEVVASTPAVTPPFMVSDEATAPQLGRALDDGKAVRAELESVEREEGAASGDLAAGEYIVSYVITPADDYYDLEAARSNSPAHHTTVQPGSAHVGVVVRDAADGRLVQSLSVRATLRGEGAGGLMSRSAMLPYGWHPVLNRYGENMILPNGPFTLDVRISMPAYRRSDRVNGERYAGDVIAKFMHVRVNSDSLATVSRRLAAGETRESIRLASREGATVSAQLSAEDRSAKASVAEARTGDYLVAVSSQPAHGYWDVSGRKLRYFGVDTSVGPIAHLSVVIRDAATGRFVPGLRVRATLRDSRRREIDTYAMPYMWHPWLNQYGLNVPRPGSGRYSVRVQADAPDFRRYGSSALRKFNRAIDVDVRGVSFGR